MAINHSPEPFSNWVASLFEDFAAPGIVWLAIVAPVLLLAHCCSPILVALWLLPKLWRWIASIFRRIATWGAVPVGAPSGATGIPPAVGELADAIPDGGDFRSRLKALLRQAERQRAQALAGDGEDGVGDGGAMGGTPGSPTPLGGSVLGTMCTSIAGDSARRSCR